MRALFGLLLAAFALPAFAQTTVTVGLNTGDDVASGSSFEISEASPTTPASTTDFYVSTYAAADERHGIFTADLSSLPTDQNVTSARIACYLLDNSGTNVDLIEWRRIIPTVNAAQATWTISSTGSPWASLGAKTNGTDRDADVSFLGPDSTATTDYRFFDASGEGLTDIENAMGVGGIAWLAQRANADINSYILCRGSGENDGLRPYLELTYEAGGGGGATIPIIQHHRRQYQ